MPGSRALALLSTCILLGSSALGQWLSPPVYTEGGDQLGFSLAVVPDADGDGWEDVLVGVPKFMVKPDQAAPGEVLLVSGATGAVLHRFAGRADDDGFGLSVASLGDATGDGVGDYVVGAFSWRGKMAANRKGPPTSAGNGYVRILDGKTREVVRTLEGVDDQGQFGWRVAGLGDVDGDGRADLAIAEPSLLMLSHSDDEGQPRGMQGWVHVYSGASGERLYTLTGGAFEDGFGRSLCRLPDRDGDGADELAVGAPRPLQMTGLAQVLPQGSQLEDFTGYVQVFSGRTGALLHTRCGPKGTQEFGQELALLDGGGLAVSAPCRDASTAAPACCLYFLRGAGLDQVAPVALPPHAGTDGHDLALLPDGELLVAAHTGQHVQAFLLSAATGALLQTVDGFDDASFRRLLACVPRQAATGERLLLLGKPTWRGSDAEARAGGRVDALALPGGAQRWSLEGE